MSEQQITSEQRKWLLTQSYLRLMHNQPNESMVLLEGLSALCPKDSDVYGMMSYVLLELNKPEECLNMVDKYQECVMPNQQNSEEIMWIKSRAQARILKNNDSSQQQEVQKS